MIRRLVWRLVERLVQRHRPLCDDGVHEWVEVDEYGLAVCYLCDEWIWYE